MTGFQSYKGGTGLITGIIIIVCGVIALPLGIVSNFVKTAFFASEAGIWMGLAFGITGSFGVLSKSKNKGFVVTYMVLTIICAILASHAVYFSIASLIVDLAAEYNVWCTPSSFLFDGKVNCYNQAARVWVTIFQLLACIVGFVACIVGSGFTCAGACCKSSAPADSHSISVNAEGDLDVLSGNPQQPAPVYTPNPQQYPPPQQYPNYHERSK